LDERARVEWWRVSPELIRLGLLTVLDRACLASYCQAVAELDIATKTLKKEGREFKTEAGYKAPHPAVAQQRSAWNAVKAFAAEFGLSPAGRAGLHAPLPDADSLDEFLEG
jgi:P27 family predicted phage terminase small subunit